MDDSILQSLGTKFSAFRTRYKPHTRIPDDLRSEILAAIDTGIDSAEISRSLKVSTTQIRQWRKRSCPADRLAKPRVLSVIPESSKDLPASLRVTYENGRLILELGSGE